MPDATQSAFLNAIANTTVRACFTSTGTLPLNIPPAELMYQFVTAYQVSTDAYNDAQTAPPYVNAVTNWVGGPIVLDGNGDPYQDIQASVKLRRQGEFSESSGTPGNTVII